MMNKQELNSYKEEFVANFDEPTQRQVIVAGNFKNAEKTSDRDAYKGVPWIDYWRAMTGRHQTTMVCSSCGKEIVVGEPSHIQRMNYAERGESVEEHKACGGHIWLTAPLGADWSGGRYITPLCPTCNNQRGKQINLNVGSVLCKELGVQ